MQQYVGRNQTKPNEKIGKVDRVEAEVKSKQQGGNSHMNSQL